MHVKLFGKLYLLSNDWGKYNGAIRRGHLLTPRAVMGAIHFGSGMIPKLQKVAVIIPMKSSRENFREVGAWSRSHS